MSLTNASPRAAAGAAKTASHLLAELPTSARNDALTVLHDALLASRDAILEANAEDLSAARSAAADGRLPSSLLSRLDLSRPGKFAAMLQGILDVWALPDPVGRVTLRTSLDDGLELCRVSSPIGVLLVIFEARPEVVANITALALKSANAVLLKGGNESRATFVAMARIMADALERTLIPNHAVQLVASRDVVPALLALDGLVDLVIPRGGNELVRFVKDNTKIPVLGHADGLCALYLDEAADVSMAVDVVLDSKTTYPAACNSLETLLVHEKVVDSLLPAVAEALVRKGVHLRCDRESMDALCSKLPASLTEKLREAREVDFRTEFLSLQLAIKTVPSLEAAVTHINTHGSHHTDGILTTCEATAERFMAAVDSAGVYWNASTRFADGMRYGFGTEVGISTNKMHARGPVGLEGLMIYKYQLRGAGHVTAVYGDGDGDGGRRFKHEPLPL